MRAAATILLIMSTTFLAACKQNQSESPSPAAPAASAAATANLTPEQLGELGAEIRKDPARAEELLAGKGLTRTSFEKAIRDVTENPEASKRYADAYRKASA